MHESWFRCLRPCPHCRTRVHTNGKKQFKCSACGWTEGIPSGQFIDRVGDYTEVAVAEPGWHV